MKICIDTNAYSAFKRGNPEIILLFETARTIVVPVVTLGELYAGFHIGTQQKRNVKELQEFLDQNGIEIKSPDQDLAERYGIIVSELRRNGTPIPSNDIWIAATALETGSRLVSYDKHFEVVPGLVIISP
jgi:predicted nucleic acid-binding protein